MWYYIKNETQQGPISEGELTGLMANGILTAETLVWKEGMADWQPARACPFFTPPPPGSPPPLPQKTNNTPYAVNLDTSLDFLPHLLGLLTGFIGPLILLLCAQQPSAKRHAREALNWQLSLLLYMVAGFVLMFVVVGFFLIFAVAILDLVFCIIASIKASQGTFWRYPMTLRLLKE